MQVQFGRNEVELLNKHISVDKDYLESVKQMHNGSFKLNRGLDNVHFKKLPEWNYEHHISSNTYQLYLHTLNFTKSMVKSFLTTNNVEDIKLAKSIVENWITKNLKNKQNKFAWYDHTVSSRIWNLLYYQVNAPRKYKLKQKTFEEVFDSHIKFLRDYNNYTENNHGIMMDRALILSAIFINDKSLREENILLAKNRIEKAIYRDFSYLDVHLENSPDYHRMVTSWLRRAAKLLEDIKQPLAETFNLKLKNAVQFNGVIADYDQVYPMIGDTGEMKTRTKKKHIDFIDYEAGIAIFNDRNSKSTLVFNCGFQKLTHKHRDDLSITLSLNKEQILVDSGKYNYNSNDEMRQHMISPRAHNTILVKDKTYALDNKDKIKLINSYKMGNFKVVKGVNNAYDGVRQSRTIVVIDNDIYIIYDRLYSEKEHVYIQNFVFHDTVNIDIVGKREYLLSTPSNRKYLMKEHSKAAAPVLFKNGEDNAVISKQFNELSKTNRLEIRKKQSNSNFLLSISPENKKINNLKIKDNRLIVEVNGKEYIVKLG